MPRFNYKARDNQGKILTGIIEGTTEDAALDKLGEKELMPITLQELRFDGSQKNLSFSEKIQQGFLKVQTKVPYKDVVFFTRQLATMVGNGVSVSRALNRLGEGEKPVFRKILMAVSDDISAGFAFSDAIAKHPGAFSQMYVSVSHSGEITGQLDRVLDELATYMENMEAMRGKVKGAMRYPVFILSFVTLLVIAIMWKLVPIFENMYGNMGAALPMPTRMLIVLSGFVRGNIILLFAGIILLVVGVKVAMAKEESFRYVVHRMILRFPVFGLILRKNIWALFSRTMSLLVECGIPILQAVEVAGAVVGNLVYSRALSTVYDSLRRGDLLSQSLEKTRVFPSLVCQLVQTGEDSGKVDELLRKAAEFYEREIRVTVDSLAAIIEPFLIILLGGIVGSILIALYMPIFSIGKYLR